MVVLFQIFLCHFRPITNTQLYMLSSNFNWIGIREGTEKWSQWKKSESLITNYSYLPPFSLKILLFCVFSVYICGQNYICILTCLFRPLWRCYFCQNWTSSFWNWAKTSVRTQHKAYLCISKSFLIIKLFLLMVTLFYDIFYIFLICTFIQILNF